MQGWYSFIYQENVCVCVSERETEREREMSVQVTNVVAVVSKHANFLRHTR